MYCRSVRLTRYPDRRALAIGRAPALFYDLGSREAPDRQDRSLLPFAYLTSGFMSALRVRASNSYPQPTSGSSTAIIDLRSLLVRGPYADSVGDDRVAIFPWSHAEFHLSQSSSPSKSPGCDHFGSCAVIMNTKFMVLPYLYRLPYTNCRPCPLGLDPLRS